MNPIFFFFSVGRGWGGGVRGRGGGARVSVFFSKTLNLKKFFFCGEGG